MKRFALLALAALLFAAPAQAQVNAPIPVKEAALSNTAVVVKASAGVLQWINCGNPNASTVYLQVFDSAGTVTVGTTPSTLSLAIPPSLTANLPASAQFFNGIQVAATTTAGGSTAPGTALACNFGIN